jgi:hypothetical protein
MNNNNQSSTFGQSHNLFTGFHIYVRADNDIIFDNIPNNAIARQENKIYVRQSMWPQFHAELIRVSQSVKR